MRMGLRGGRGGVARRGWDEGEVVEAAWHPTPPPCEAASLHAGAEGAAECMGCGAWDAGGSVDPQDGLFYCSACWDGVDSGVFARRWLCAGDRTPLEDGGADGRAGELRVVSYNILGEYHALRPLHDYCPLELRVWAGDGGRAQRIAEELAFYDGDVVCMQEVTPRMYDLELGQLLGGAYDGIHSVMQEPDEERQVLAPRSSVQDEAAVKGKALDDIGLATFFKRETYGLDAWQSSELRDYLPLDRPVGALRDKLQSLAASALLLLLRCRATGQQVLIVNTQLFWHPESPHVKALQTDLVCRAISDFLARRTASPTAEGCAGVLGGDVPVVLCGDFNSVPQLQVEYLPPRQQEYLFSLMNPRDGEEEVRDVGPEPDSRGERGAIEVEGPEEEGLQALPEEDRCSGVVQLLQSSVLHQSHPEHPDCFGTAWEGPGGGKPFSLMSLEEKKLMRKLKKKQHRFNPSWNGRSVLYGNLSTHGLTFKHAYASAWESTGAARQAAGDGAQGQTCSAGAVGAVGAVGDAYNILRALPMTTCTSSFRGSIDHIWHSSGLHLRGILELPYAEESAHDFPFIPNHLFPSDHLAIGAAYTLAPSCS